MTKEEALKMIDEHKNSLINPVNILNWTWLRLIVLHMADGAWDAAVEKATETASR